MALHADSNGRGAIRLSGGRDVAARADSRYRFEWNNFDIGGCDYPEVLESTQVYVCGDGFGISSGSDISGVMNGNAFLETSERHSARASRHIGSRSLGKRGCLLKWLKPFLTLTPEKRRSDFDLDARFKSHLLTLRE